MGACGSRIVTLSGASPTPLPGAAPFAAAARTALPLAHRLAAAALAEQDRWVLWLPVLVGVGVGLYFGCHSEPPPWLGGGAVVLSVLLAGAAFRLAGPRSAVLPMATLAVIAVAAGFAGAQGQSLLLATRMLAAPVGPAVIDARIVAAESFPDGQRLTLAGPAVAGGGRTPLPERVRVRLRGSQPALRPGEQVRVRAMLMAPPAPLFPGDYDFQRQAYFEGLGAVGYSVGRAQVLAAGSDADGGPGLLFARWRFAVGERVRASLDGATAAVALALLTGEQRAIPETTMQAIRDSGLAHLLSISGLHIGLVAGMVFIAVRGGLALIPPLALRLPTKKLAAVVSVFAAGAYTLLADAPVPSQRSFLMVAVVLLAVLVDRQGISIRLVAFAALVILLTQPASMLGPSFQMSFAAVVALIAVYEVLQQRRRPPAEPRGPLRLALLYVGGVVLSTLVASLATTPFAVYHFSRFQLWGVAANMAAVPITGFWIMPWAVVAMLLMPLGWEGVGLQPMGWGVDAVIVVARTVAAWPAAVVLLPPLPTASLVMISLGGLWLCLWQRRWRLLGLIPVAAGASALLVVRPPDVLVAADGGLLAVRGGDGLLAFSSKGAGRSTREAWLRRSAAALPGNAWPASGVGAGGALRCDPLGCVYRMSGWTLAFPRTAEALPEDCRLADVVIGPIPVRGPCPSVQARLDRRDLLRGGVHALWLGPHGIHISSVDGERGDRPWVLPRAATGSFRPAAMDSSAARPAAKIDGADEEADEGDEARTAASGQ